MHILAAAFMLVWFVCSERQFANQGDVPIEDHTHRHAGAESASAEISQSLTQEEKGCRRQVGVQFLPEAEETGSQGSDIDTIERIHWFL